MKISIYSIIICSDLLATFTIDMGKRFETIYPLNQTNRPGLQPGLRLLLLSGQGGIVFGQDQNGPFHC